jgi:hypothetical protein
MGSQKSFKKFVSKSDSFRVNTAFTSKHLRIQINAIQKKENKKESELVHKRVLADRKFLIDAAIVKTMKQHRKLTRTELER